MGKIVLLDDLTINQIAAGEVIERPASVVKELVENSIDAGATSVSIEVKNGGIKQIKIIDNGQGIAKDDLEFAFERHATSKIRTAEDLDTVKSMGFRGEALASIAAIAHVELVTKTENEFIGSKVVIEGGDVLEKEEIGTQKGTSITVSNLFYNTPVRYKFLKKDFSELGYIEDTVKRIALANPNVAIRLSSETKTLIKTAGNGDLKTAIYNIYGKEIADGIIDIDYKLDDIRVTGVVGKPEIARGNRTFQMFFVNKRFVKDKTLTASAEQAFKGLVPIGKFGFLVLNIEMDPRKIDVNVHPTKLEIRFSDEQSVFKAVYHAIREGLLKGDLVKNSEREIEIKKDVVPEAEIITEPQKIDISQETQRFAPITNVEPQTTNIKPEEPKKVGLFSIFKKRNDDIEKNVENNAIEQIFSYKNNDEPYKADVPYSQTENMDFGKMYNETFGVKIDDKKDKPEKVTNYSFADVKNISVFEDKETYSNIPAYKFCGIVFSTYIIIEMGNEMYIIDQHAAHERILYEEIKKNYYENADKDSQIMLLPDIITLSHKEKSLVKENIDLFRKAGFMLEEFGENTIRLIGVPSICMDMDTKELFLEILDTIDTVAITAKQEKEDKFIATVACKAAVKANMALTKEEVDNLMKKLLILPNPFTCPHGRPTAIKMEKVDIERKFNRRK